MIAKPTHNHNNKTHNNLSQENQQIATKEKLKRDWQKKEKTQAR